MIGEWYLVGAYQYFLDYDYMYNKEVLEIMKDTDYPCLIFEFDGRIYNIGREDLAYIFRQIYRALEIK